MTLIGQTAEFVPVKVKEALTQPEGFYSTLNSIDPSNRKLVIIRLPQDIPTSALDGMKVSMNKERFVGSFQKNNTRFEVNRCTGPTASAVAFALPVDKEAKTFDELWTINRVATLTNMDDPNDDTPFTFDSDIGGGSGSKGDKISQPNGLFTGLSAIDYSTLIKRSVRKRPLDSTEKSLKTKKSKHSE